MKNWIISCLVCCWACAGSAGAAAPPPAPAVLAADTAYPQDAAQDGGGQTWGVVPNGPAGMIAADGPPSGLCRWAGGGWRAVRAPQGVSGQPHALGRTASGAVVCLWDSGDEHLITAHRGSFSRLVARFPGFLRAPRLFGDHAGNVWVTSLGGDVYRVPAKIGTRDKPEQAYSVADADYFPGYQKSNEGPDQGREAGLFFHDPLLAAEDSRGRMWFWTDRLAGSDNFAGLRGVLRWEGGRMVPHAGLAGLPDKPLDWVAPRGPGHMWVAVHGVGVYDVDADALRGVPVAEPQPHAFQYVQKMFGLGADWYVVTGASTNTHPGTLTSALWRQRGGRWRKLLDGIDTQTDFQDFATRPVLRTPAGLWVGSFGAGAWLLPSSGGPPVHLDWHYGYALASTNRLFSLPGASGGVVAFMDGWGTGRPQTHLEARVLRAPSGLVRTLTTSHPLVQDPQGHIWNLDAPRDATGKDGGATLSEWDGTAWTPHPLPPEAVPASVASLNADSRGRLWLVPYLSGGRTQTFVFDPARRSWQAFRSFDAALLAQTDAPPVIDMQDWSPAFSRDGRVAYRTQGWHLHTFDGHIWHDWTAKDLGRPGPLEFAFSPPFFGKTGLLCVNAEISPPDAEKDRKTMAWTEQGGWHTAPYEEGPQDFAAQTRKSLYAHPPALPVMPDPSSIAQDGLGAYWLTSGHVVYRATAAGSRAAFPPSVPTPFSDGRRITGAMTDPLGNTFLDTSLGNADEYVLVPAPTKAPQP